MAELATPDLPALPASIYPPAEDSHLLISTLAEPAQRAFLTARFCPNNSAPSPLVFDVGTGSGLALAFATVHARALFGRQDILTLGVDANHVACQAASVTATAVRRCGSVCLGAVQADLSAALKLGSVDVLLCNPPYVPTETVPDLVAPPLPLLSNETSEDAAAKRAAADHAYALESHALAATWSGGYPDGMEVTARLLEDLPRVLSAQGCAYVLLCARNRPEAVVRGVRGWGSEGPGGKGAWWRVEDPNAKQQAWWEAEVVGQSGGQGGWERLVIMRISRSLRDEMGPARNACS